MHKDRTAEGKTNELKRHSNEINTIPQKDIKKKIMIVNRRERDHWGDLGVDGWIILGWISSRWDVGIWTGLGWLRIETGGGRL